MLRLALMVGAVALAPRSAFALSNAAAYLASQEIGTACGGASGRYDPAYVVERDLDGDGRADLLIAHEGIECDGTGRSAECGMLACSIRIWLRRGELLELAVDDLQGYDVAVGAGPTPEIRWVASDGAPVSIRWDRNDFR
ncbi:MAG TPA: hypothetical protein VM422_14260 [Amaricoccus sp.]|jgi:hypothetical protein|nr:hypothetical protein [Amaricoccus sp.]